MRVLVDGGGDCAFLEIRGHFLEKIGGDEPHLSPQAACAECPADRQTIDGIHIYSGKRWNAAQQLARFLEALILIFVSFDHGNDFAAWTVLRKSFRKSMRLLTMVFRHQHTGHHRYFGPRRQKLPHQFAGETSVQVRLDANDTGAPAVRGVGRYANHADTLVFCFIDQRGQTLGVPGGQNNSIHTARDELFERLGVPLAKGGHRAIHEFNAQLRNAPLLLQHPTPKLIVEKVNFPRDTHADTRAGPRHRKRARGKIRRVSDLLGNLQDAPTRGLLNPTAPVQRPVNRANRYASNFCNELNPAQLFSHRGGFVRDHRMPVREPSTEQLGNFRSTTSQPALRDRRSILPASLVKVIRKPAGGASVTNASRGVWFYVSLQCAAAMIL